MANLRVELYSIEMTIRVAHRRNRSMLCAGVNLEPFRQLDNVVAVAHPNGLNLVQSKADASALCEFHLSLAILALACTLDLALQLMRHHLHAIANTENRNIQIVDRWIYER
ncbi:hypothetical protein D3C80_1770720 [compost metagenome]